MIAGAGHRRAAEALAAAARARDPQAKVECLDALEGAPLGYRRAYAWTYLALVRWVPWLWDAAFRLLDADLVSRLVQPLRRRWNLWIAARFVRRLRALQPDAVLVTHFLPADVCAAGRQAGWLRGPLIVVVTDLFPHRFWTARHADALVTGTPEGAGLLRRRGIAPDKIHEIGIPIGAAFGASPAAAALRRRLALDPGRRAILVTSGGTTVGRFDQVVTALRALEARIPGRLQLVVVCGEDRRMARRLEAAAAASAMPVRVFGFVDDMADLMAASDLIVCKAGGLTVSEAIGSGLPLVLYHVIPGQEELNAAYVERQGAGVIARRPEAAAEAVARLIEDQSRWEAMRRAVVGLRRPDAARRIIDEVVWPLMDRRAAR